MGLGEFETVMQTRDAVEGLHKFRKYFSKRILQMKRNLFIYFLIGIDFLNTRSGQSYFLLANQNSHLTTHEPIKICVIKVEIKSGNLWRVDESNFSFESS